MKDKLGTIAGFLFGTLLIGFGIIWPDNLSNFYVYKIVDFENRMEQAQKSRKATLKVKKLKKEIQEFKESWMSAFSKFIDLKSFLIVFGGAFAAVMIAFPSSKAFSTFGYIARVFLRQRNPEEFLQVYYNILEFAEKRVQDDPISDEDINAVQNEELQSWLKDFIAVDLVEERMIDEIIRSEIEMYNYRAFEEIDVLEFMGRTTPAFGMVGTVVGLILMLSRAGGEGGSVTDIMGAMSVALITTLYGVLIAQMIFIPVASKRYQSKQADIKLMEMIREGILYLKRKEIPDVIAKDLEIYLPPENREKLQRERLAAMKSGDLGL